MYIDLNGRPNPDDAARESIERMIDQYGLPNFLFAVSVICTEKAEHLAVNWQAPHSASVWTKISEKIEKTAAYAKQEGLL